MIQNPQFDFLSELYAEDAPECRLLAEYPSSNSDETIFQNRNRFVIHDPFPPPRVELLKLLGPHHLMFGWGRNLEVTSQVKPSEILLQHWEQVLGSRNVPIWRPLDSGKQHITIFPHESLSAESQIYEPESNYALHSKEIIEQIDCPQAEVYPTIQIPCIVKLSHGYAGLGNFRIESEIEKAQVLSEVSRRWPDAKLVYNSIIENIVGDYGVQFYIRRNGEVLWLGLTQQNFDENARWCGGVYSLKQQSACFDQFAPIVEATAKVLSENGYFGVAGVDILETSEGKNFLVDVNPRLTGITPFLIAARIFAHKENTPFGIYKASCRFNGPLSELIDVAETHTESNIIVLSAFEDQKIDSTQTICHLSASSKTLEAAISSLQILLNSGG